MLNACVELYFKSCHCTASALAYILRQGGQLIQLAGHFERPGLAEGRTILWK